MIDFHSHIIPGVDDGAKNEEAALAMLQLAAEMGTKKIVATPHYVRGRFQVSREEIHKKVQELRVLADKNRVELEIFEGQEVYYSESILQYYLEGEINTIENTRYMLVELPMKTFQVERVIESFYELQLKGLVIILAHPERYEDFIKEPSLINRFLEEGFLFQLNTGSISGEFGKEVKKTAEIFLNHGVYSVIGSDGHRLRARNTNMKPGISELEALQPGCTLRFMDNMEKILKDEEVRNQGTAVKEEKGIKGLLKKIFS